ncbi:Uncharacterised protein [Buttiauxella agrestis]|uniref:Uncharacterized protein n=1 Tax=Buttiauxella agrestis TaxID=82977 RepID=A0A381C8A3_9ENTR|nr:hypothetical protein [Buttiauxella agrestis]SUW64047.1 Uncharacterised protein [Buttiauxella agrestis]
MKNYKLYLWMSFFSLIAILPFLGGYYLQHKNTNFACDGEMVLHDSHAHTHVFLHFRFYKNTGTYNVSGNSIFNNGQRIVISQNSSFSYTTVESSTGSDLVLVSLEDIIYPGNLGHANAVIPDFFRFRGRGVSLRISRVNDTGYLFQRDATPVLYCKRSLL